MKIRYALSILTFIAILFTRSGEAKAQLIVDTTYSVQYLVQNVMNGFGASVSNITYTGNSAAIGFFDASNSSLGLDSGIVLSSGSVMKAMGPNTSGSISTIFSNPGDPDLTALAGNTTNDAAVLELDFVASSDTFSFFFVFGSEEYPEFINSSYNDIFAFFISGPGITGQENIALIPGTNIPVAIRNINQNINPQYYVNNTGGATVQYDGYTVVMEATKGVVPGQTYHLKIAIADVLDRSYDSGVFLMKNCAYDPVDIFFNKSGGPVEASCVDSVITVPLTSHIVCSTIAADGSDFRIVAADGTVIPIIGASSANCVSGNYTKEVTIRLLKPFFNTGPFYVFSKMGNDNNTLIANCSASMVEFDTIEVIITECYEIFPDLLNVTVLENDSIQVQWTVAPDTGSIPWIPEFNRYAIMRGDSPTGTYTEVASFSSLNDTMFTDLSVDVHSQNYNYKVKVFLNNGFQSSYSDSIQSILLKRDTSNTSDTTHINLNWTEYWGWGNPEYHIMFKKPGSDWETIAQTTNLSYPFEIPQLLMNGQYHLKVKTPNENPTQSLFSESNWITFEIALRPVEAANIMTPNNDGKNDSFLFKWLYFYPGSKLQVFNRWGKKIYKSDDYQNDWTADGESDGTYYYTLHVNDHARSVKTGTITIIK